ncbi:hypothetical protein Mgra_00008913 [Meloidogyne graminicola]|uniref:Uncharacterized protein n=1 Tax=Meloidogyne graminicola TaxID=189291 RepID=A0A8S9ZEF5_9BILA|nr:hypothetical protein Mgra_00008913 [Meloidogyne graminicola]
MMSLNNHLLMNNKKPIIRKLKTFLTKSIEAICKGNLLVSTLIRNISFRKIEPLLYELVNDTPSCLTVHIIELMNR